MRKGRLRIRERERERERELADRSANNWPIIRTTRARVIYKYIHTHRCEIIKQTIKMRIRMNSSRTSPFAVDAAQPMMWFKQ
mgnify:CR=1 FL=1